MSLTDIASYIGAAAWLYPIYTEIKRKITKPTLHVFPVDSIQLGYTSLGPMIFLQCAINSEKTEALIVRVKIMVVHEDGDSHILTWKTLDETQFHFRSFSGEGGTIEKSQLATAIKISTGVPIEKRIGFVDPRYQEESQQIIDKLFKQTTYKRNIQPELSVDEVFKEQEFFEWNSYFKKEMYWKVGRYSLDILVYAFGLKKPLIKKYEFELDSQKIDFLTFNTTLLEQSIKASVSKSPQVTWGWVFPRITEKET
jgi:hypothetical protein